MAYLPGYDRISQFYYNKVEIGKKGKLVVLKADLKTRLNEVKFRLSLG